MGIFFDTGGAEKEVQATLRPAANCLRKFAQKETAGVDSLESDKNINIAGKKRAQTDAFFPAVL